MHRFYTKLNTADGQQLGKREETAGLALALLTSQLECMRVQRWLGHLSHSPLRSQRQQQEQAGVGQEDREEKRSDTHLGREDAVFCGHSKADARCGTQKQQENSDIH